MNYIFYAAIALLPSIIWLLYYLRKDRHPEPKAMILKIFIWGMLVAFPVLVVEGLAIEIVLPILPIDTLISYIGELPYLIIDDAIQYLFIVAVAEEFGKYFVVKFRVINRTTELDEPIDAMEYMIISALGFAAIENIFLLTPLFENDFVPTLGLAFSRFIGATFLHVLASATIGYYIALSFYGPAKKARLLIHGFLIAILLHGFYNILVVRIGSYPYLLILVALLMSFSAYTISKYFKTLLNMQSITKL